MEERLGINAKTIQRRVQIANLPDTYLNFVDTKGLGLGAAYHLSYLNEPELDQIYETKLSKGVKINEIEAKKIHKKLMAKDGF